MGLGKAKVWRSGLSDQSLGFLKMKLLPDCLQFPASEESIFQDILFWASQKSPQSFHFPPSLVPSILQDVALRTAKCSASAIGRQERRHSKRKTGRFLLLASVLEGQSAWCYDQLHMPSARYRRSKCPGVKCGEIAPVFTDSKL